MRSEAIIDSCPTFDNENNVFNPFFTSFTIDQSESRLKGNENCIVPLMKAFLSRNLFLFLRESLSILVTPLFEH